MDTVSAIGHNARLIQLDAGPPRHFDKYAVLEYLPDLACNLQRFRNFSGAHYDVIHAHYWLSGRLALPFRDRWRAPLVSTFHTLGRMKNDVAQDDAEREEAARIDIERRVMTCSDRVIASTPVDEAQLVKLYGVQSSKISVVSPGVDLEKFRPYRKSTARGRLGFGEGPLVLFVGRIQRLKGIDILLRAIAALDEYSPGLRPTVAIVGGAPEQEQVDAERREIGKTRPAQQISGDRGSGPLYGKCHAGRSAELLRGGRRDGHAVNIRIIRSCRAGIHGVRDTRCGHTCWRPLHTHTRW